MEQAFLLKHYGNISLDEMRTMTGEERNWWLQRLDKEHKKEKDTTRSGNVPGKPSSIPGAPPI
jgi:hypothetical protein